MTTVYAIADLHLSGFPPRKPMSIFGENWNSHWEKICIDWKSKVDCGDIVVIAGDISWGMNMTEAIDDLQAIHELPGRKILVRGNHDYWWATNAKLRQTLPPSFDFIHNSFVGMDRVAFCGSRGWLNPADSVFSEQDGKIYEREKGRILASLELASQAGYERKILVTHYPMYYAGEHEQEFDRKIAGFGVEQYLFGHLHGEAAKLAMTGLHNGMQHHLISCDALDFKLKKIVDL